jgi:hypothetical protein
MPKYCFEVRFRASRPIATDRIEQEFKAVTFKQPLSLSRAEGMNTRENWLVVRSCGYADHREAEASAEQLQEQLLIVAAKQEVGVEFYLRGATKAHVYPDGTLDIRDAGLPLPVALSADDLKKTMDEAVSSAVALTTNQRVAAELLNDSFFDMPPEARFLLRVSAIEALCPQAGQTEAFNKVVIGLIGSIPKETADADRNRIEHALKMLAARKSVGSSCKAKIKQLLGDNKAKQFQTLYDQRSRFIHKGAGRGTLNAPAGAALELAWELLLADIGQSAGATATQ